jgi:prevent-host-death family protein
MKIAAGKFKACCLQVLREVQERHEEVVVTKHGKPVAKVVPVAEEAPQPIIGCMRGTATITGDIVGPIGVKWNADE